MKKTILILLAAVLMVSFSSNAQSRYTKTMSEKECHQMLENFLLSNYNSMFDRTYFKNSFVIDKMKTYTDNSGYKNVEINGRHSFRTKGGDNYNNKYIDVHVRYNDNKYEITLTLSKYFCGMSTHQVSSTRVYYL